MSIALPLGIDAAFAVELTAKATLVLLATAAAAGVVALRRGSAATRHLVWTLGVCGVLALPLLSATLPGWRTPLLPIPTARAADPSTFTGEPVAARPASSSQGEVPGRAAPSAVDPVVVRTSGEGAMNGIDPGMAIVAAYLLGVLAVLGRLAIGRWSVARLGRQAETVNDAAWTGQLRDVAWELGISRPVRLLRGGGATMPMTWGIAHPAVLLPAESAEWPEERRRVVLMHELAHVARHDCLTQTLAAAACALYWFHPALWYAARRLRVERELACDDRVLQAGTRARDYAAHLLEVARAFRPAPLAGPVAVSMARPSQLEGRLLAVLDGVRDRGVPGRAAASVAAMGALALLLPLAAIRPGNAQQAVPAGVTFGGPRPWKDTDKPKPPRGSDAYPDLAAATRQGASDVTIAVRPGQRLTLRLPERVNARVEAWDRPSVHVRVDDPGLHLVGVSTPDGARVTVTGRPRTDGTSPHVRIQAPRDFNVHTEADGGGVEIGALNGTFTGTVTGGGLAFVGTRGTVRMTAHGGGASISNAHLDGRLEMDGGGVLMGGNSGNLDVTGASATAQGRPGGRLRVDVPGRAGTGDTEIACAGEACTITSAPVRGSGARTSVATSRGGGEVAAGTGSASTTVVETDGGQTVSVTAGSGQTVRRSISSSIGRASESGGYTATSGFRTWLVPRAGGGRPDTMRTQWEVARERDGRTIAFMTGEMTDRMAALHEMALHAPLAAAAAAIGQLAFSEPDEPVQHAAVKELAQLRSSAAREQLRRISREHPREAVRARAAAELR